MTDATTVRWEHTHDEQSLVALFRSFSDMRVRPQAEREHRLDQLRAEVRQAGGEVTRAYATPVVLARAP